ncbi:TPA: hypothetical protein KRG84_003178 [Clostridioides difficile]|nr:hypothetical protein [Clostridioides difficile]EQJ62369.1 hypothetical protein QSQ_0684 [Clostridioides difficile P32]EIS9413000.1 hypothetical protein [Clostridioides difficile]EQE23882.1 hypothetical protein QAW_0690 [Clostridioides difficile CD17]EQE65049.1 hypothetical protein QCM_0658 [Clostridioides difficile CD46]EQH43440.1 hypothetical protein QMA_0729 [Clostridioides difficile DA00244]
MDLKEKNIKQFTTKLQQMKEPYMTTYTKKYKDMEKDAWNRVSFSIL